jgi:fumarate reductase (CoM/CoB) subunit A
MEGFLMKKYAVEKTDVLIIGAAIAGIRAAIEAHDQGAQVTILNKGSFGRDGASTWMAGYGFAAALYPPDSLETHIQDTLKAGKFLNNQEAVQTWLALTPQGANEMSKWGTRFEKESKGRFKQIILPGHSYPRSLITRMSALYPGPQYSRALTTQARRREIKVVRDLFVTDLICQDGQVAGAAAIDLADGSFRIFQAKTTMLATGGFSACFPLHTNGTGATGDGQAMALRAGAKLMDMEFQQFMPAAGLWPPSIQGSLTPYGMLVSLYGHYLNDQGERFMERYYPKTKDWATRQETARAIANEVRVGLGSPHGGAFLTFKHQPRNILNRYLDVNENDPVVRKLRASKIDLHYDAFEVAPHAHYSQGGCWVNPKCETSLERLYAIGEVASGQDGADRLAANALAFCFSMGIVGGKGAALKAKSSDFLEIEEDHLAALEKEAYAPLNRQKGVQPKEIKNKIFELLKVHGSFYRNQQGLEQGIKEITAIRQNQLAGLSTANKDKKYNIEWVEALEIRNSVDIAEALFRSAEMRKESRGAHERSDYPDEDSSWLKNIIIQKSGDQMELHTEPVRFSYMKPPKGE